jgi:hypothetical protein
MKGKLPVRRRPPQPKLRTPELRSQADGQRLPRAALNGNPFWLAYFWAESNIFCLSGGISGFAEVSPMIQPEDVAKKLSRTVDMIKKFEGKVKGRPGLSQGEARSHARRRNYSNATTNGE